MINNENALVIDLRDRESFKKGHIIDSINATAEDFEQPKMNKYKNKTIILVCARGLQSPSCGCQNSYSRLSTFGTGWRNCGVAKC